MDISTQHDGHRLIISLAGRRDMAGAPGLERLAQEELERGERDFILELSGLTHVSSAGLRSLLLLSREALARGGDLLVCGRCGGMAEVFQVSGFAGIFKMDPTLEAAKAVRV